VLHPVSRVLHLENFWLSLLHIPAVHKLLLALLYFLLVGLISEVSVPAVQKMKMV